MYKSPGITIFPTRPKTTSLRGRVVKERIVGGSKDVDYMAITTQLFADWTGKFIDTENSLAKFHLYLSTVPGGRFTEYLT